MLRMDPVAEEDVVRLPSGYGEPALLGRHLPGPGTSVAAAHAGALACDPGAVKAPVLIERGEWGSSSTDADAAWLCGQLGSADRWDVKIAEATHLMHLEHGREGLFAARSAFLAEAGGT